MKIITWNCNMAFRKKAEHPDKLLFQNDILKPTDTLWFGRKQNKGLAVFSYSDFRFKVLDVYNEEFKMIIPIAVTGGDFDFNLFAVWAYTPDDKDGKYITQVWKAINHYDELMRDKPCILIGDFNSNTIWDYKKHQMSNHSSVVEALEEKGIFSIYHLQHNQRQGKEQHPTYYMYRHRDKPYHIDYCFASAGMIKQLKAVEIGEYDSWIKYSDHVPVIITFIGNQKE